MNLTLGASLDLHLVARAFEAELALLFTIGSDEKVLVAFLRKVP